MTSTYQTHSIDALFTDAERQLQTNQIEQGLDTLHEELGRLRSDLSAGEWLEIRERFGRHPMRGLLHLSPLSRRAYEKPRGYAGDAVMLDYIYDHEKALPAISTLGQRVLRWETATVSSRSVRNRRKILARALDTAGGNCVAPRVLSVACGHLREAQDSMAVRSGRIGELLAFDQDEESLSVIRNSQRNAAIRCIRGSVRDILRENACFPGMDLVYSAGLYDYLNLRTAQRLTSLLYSMVRPGGTLLVANFAPNLADIAYMEICMDWDLIYRDESDILEVAAELPWDAGRRVFRDEDANIVFLEVRRP
jgi:extracellular factor (EF) 3-hydroxypalmitic acid methyl ester biosynthesis protein